MDNTISNIEFIEIPTYSNEQIEELKKTGLIGYFEGTQVSIEQ